MTALSQLSRKPEADIPQIWPYGLIALWAIAMVCLPIARWIAGDAIIAGWVTMAAVLQAIAVFVAVAASWGWQRAALTFAIVAFMGWGAEFLGHKTGIPFGDYHYTEALQPQIGGVPLLIPIAWFMLLPSAWVMAQCIVPDHKTITGKLAFVVFSALALTAWDLFLDPQMVGWGFWEWAQPGIYFGIPISNYVGWLAVSAIITLVVQPKPLSALPLVLIYGLVWFLQTVGLGVFWGQAGPALVGSLAMGAIMLLAFWQVRKQQIA